MTADSIASINIVIGENARRRQRARKQWRAKKWRNSGKIMYQQWRNINRNINDNQRSSMAVVACGAYQQASAAWRIGKR